MKSSVFTHTHSAFEGIENVYADEILPQLLPLEAQRQAFWKSFKRLAPLLVAVVCAVTIFIFLKTSHIGALIFGVFANVGGLTGLYHYKSKLVRQGSKAILMKAISDHIGLLFQSDLHMPDDFLYGLQELKLISGRIDRSHYEDSISGKFDGTDVKICEAKLERKVKSDKGDKWQTVFRGSLIEMDFHREFLGTTIVLRDGGIFNSKRKGEMKRIGLASPKFEKIFEAYGTDQVEGRYLLTPTFMETLMDLEESVDGNKIRFAFHNNSLHIAVEHPNRFETKSLREPMTDISVSYTHLTLPTIYSV